MNSRKVLVTVIILVVILGIAASAAGLFFDDDGHSFTVTTVHGQTVEIYGHGLYKNDSLFKGGIFRGTDAVTLFIAIPLLLLSLWFYIKGSMRGKLLLTGLLSYFVYYSASLAFGVTYNNLVLVYIALFSASFFAFISIFKSVDLEQLSQNAAARFPHRSAAVFLALAGMSLTVWLMDIVTALLAGKAPQFLGNYTTEITYVIDLGIIFPLAFLSVYRLVRRDPAGYLLSVIMVSLNALIGLVVMAQTAGQTLAGVKLTVAQLVIYVGVFTVMSAFAIWLLVRMLLSVLEAPSFRSN